MEWAVVLMLFLVFSGVGGYVFLMIFFPEWVGITGKSAHQTLSDHREGTRVDDSDPFSSLPDDKKN
jgi:hypothetical protein